MDPLLCKNLLALWLVEPDGSGKYASAVSFDRAVLEEMLVREVDEETRPLYQIEPVHVYIQHKKKFFDERKRWFSGSIYKRADDLNFYQIEHTIYAHYINNEQTLVSCKEQPKEGDETFSAVPIQLDVFYGEGIMNA